MSSDELAITDEASSYSSRVSAARVQGAIGLIEELYEGQYEGDGPCAATLSAEEYNTFRMLIEKNKKLKGFFEDQLRFEYSRREKHFEIRLPTAIGENAAAAFTNAVVVWPFQLAKDAAEEVLGAVKNIQQCGHTNINFRRARGRPDTKSPDASFGHNGCELGCRTATVVLEVACVHTQDDLYASAKRYICGRKSSVRTVVGLNLHEMYLAELRNEKRGYSADRENETAEATFSVWRATKGPTGKRSVEVVVSNEVFRDKEGSAVPSAAIRLCLADFVSLCKGINNGLEQYRRMNSKDEMDVQEETEPQIDSDSDDDDDGGTSTSTSDVE
ncbi:hypothetical protein F5Y10DRAFT_288733 [Nemania abortiva]|nr:hypothetical protein F5Y10DRAFT_288733 [Nemania abortiva]